MSPTESEAQPTTMSKTLEELTGPGGSRVTTRPTRRPI